MRDQGLPRPKALHERDFVSPSKSNANFRGTGKGTNTATSRYWGSGAYIWNNDKDTASQYNQYGALVDRCSYNNPNASQKYC